MLMRSKLFVPASRPELFEKAFASPADALSFDLEDAVAQSQKSQAREHLVTFLRGLRSTVGKTIVVRINAFGTEEFDADVSALGGTPVDILNLPMAEDEAAVIEAIAQIERSEALHSTATERRGPAQCRDAQGLAQSRRTRGGASPRDRPANRLRRSA